MHFSILLVILITYFLLLALRAFRRQDSEGLMIQVVALIATTVLLLVHTVV